MMSSALKPRVRRTAHSTLSTYSFSRRVHDVQPYPVRSPQGASIVIYGHGNGVSLIWRGGQRFRPQPEPATEAKPNGEIEDVVMVIDSDEEESASTARPEFEDAAETTASLDVTQTLDLSLGAAILNVAVIPKAPCSAEEAAKRDAPLLAQKIVFAVSCATGDIFVITLPLTPPSPAKKARHVLRADLSAGKAGSGAWEESVVVLGGQKKHADDLAITLTKKPPSEEQSSPTHIVVAACSKQASGVLALWHVPLEKSSKSEGALQPFQTEYLAHPLLGISFNPLHTDQLLAVSSHHAARVYDFATSPFPPDAESNGPFPSQGSWLLSLYQPFAKLSASRKPILDAVWILNGRAIFILLADGMWGIWDVDGVNRLSSGTTGLDRFGPGVRGGALTAFSASGYVEGTSSLRSLATQQNETQRGDFAPITPHARRRITAALTASTPLDGLMSVHGGIKAISLPGATRAMPDEGLVLWVGGQDHVCLIPSISKFWESQLRKESGNVANPFSGAQPARMVRLADLSEGLLGERCCGVSLAALPPDKTGGERSGEETVPFDVIVQGESRLVFVKHALDSDAKTLRSISHNRRKQLLATDDTSDAIIVRGKNGRTRIPSYNLSTSKPGTLRIKPTEGSEVALLETEREARNTLDEPLHTRTGFDFSTALNAAADVSADLTRDLELEMLDVMEIDQALNEMEAGRENAEKQVMFE